MTTPATMNALLDELRKRFSAADADSRSPAGDDWQDGYRHGYRDALGEIFEHLTGDSPAAAIASKTDSGAISK